MTGARTGEPTAVKGQVGTVMNMPNLVPGHCYSLNVHVPCQKSCAEILPPKSDGMSKKGL